MPKGPKSRTASSTPDLIEGWPVSGRYPAWHKRQYVALLEAVGNVQYARHLMEPCIVWAVTGRPKEKQLRAWEMDWADSKYPVKPEEVRKMRQRIRAWQEAKHRMLIDKDIDMGAKMAKMMTEKIERGEEIGDDRVLHKYNREQISYGLMTANNVWGGSKPQQSQINKLIINAGAPPAKHLKAGRASKDVIIDAEFKELPSGEPVGPPADTD